MAQGSREWIQARLGIPTASQFHRIISSKTMKPSASAGGYLYELVAERIIGESLDELVTAYMERGAALEDEAVKFYELQRNLDTERVGFCLRDDGRVGCSPDRLVGGDGGLEIKCPSAKTHVGYLIGEPQNEYRAQVQGCLWITGRDWWDWLSFHPDMPPALIRFRRDEEFIAALDEAMSEFLGRLDGGVARVRARMNDE